MCYSHDLDTYILSLFVLFFVLSFDVSMIFCDSACSIEIRVIGTSIDMLLAQLKARVLAKSTD